MISSLLGFMVGLSLGLTGAGGGILAVPALVVVLGLNMVTAAPIALIAVGLAATTGALDGFRHHIVRYKAAMLMALIGSLMSPLGVWLALRLPEFWLMLLFSAVMFIVALRMFKQALSQSDPKEDQTQIKVCMVSDITGKFIWNSRSTLTIGSIGAISGLLTGLLGVGGGFIIVPMLKRYTNLGMHSIVTTSLMVIALVSAVTVANALATSSALDHPATWPFVALVIAGMVSGRLIAPKIPATWIQVGFSLVCSLAACTILLKAFAVI